MTVSESEIVLDVNNLTQDIFSNIVSAERKNQIEVHFDNANWTDYVATTKYGGGQGGNATQTGGHVHFTSGTAATGGVTTTTVDNNKYRPMSESYFAFTAAWHGGSSATSEQEVGTSDASGNNGLGVGYQGNIFGIYWRNNGVLTFIPISNWDDKCDGSSGSMFTRGGVPEALNPAFSNIYRFQIGWLGTAGFILSVYSPDGKWIPVYTLKRANSDGEPFMTDPDLYMRARVIKTSGTENLSISCNCWAAGNTSTQAPISETVTDRTLAEVVKSVITGRSSQGGGTYYQVKVAPSGAIISDVTGSTVAVSGTVNTSDATTQTLLNNILQSLQTGITSDQGAAGSSQWLVKDDYASESHDSDQLGADAVLTFNVTAGQMVLVDVDPVDPTDSDNYRCRAMCDGSVPTATNGFVCRPGPTYLPVPTSGVVNVYAPTGVVVAVHSFVRQ